MPRSVREHFPWLTAQERDRLFHRPPGGVASDAPAGQLGHGLGATIYIPSGRPNLLAALRQAGECGAVAAVVCLEDSVATEDLLAAEQNLSVELVGGALDGSSLVAMLFITQTNGFRNNFPLLQGTSGCSLTVYWIRAMSMIFFTVSIGRFDELTSGCWR